VAHRAEIYRPGTVGRMEARVRPAKRGEEEALVAMYEWLFESPGRRPPGWDPDRAREVLRDAVESGASLVLVAEDDGAFVGLLTASLDIRSVRFGQRCWVEDLAVDPRRRSEGIGRRLLADARAWASENGASHLELDTGVARTDAQRFYEREGATNKGISYSWWL